MNSIKRDAIIGIATAIEAYILYLSQMCVPIDPIEGEDVVYPTPFNWTLLQPLYDDACIYMKSIAFWSFIALIALIVFLAFLKKRDDKVWLGNLFKHILDQHLGGETFETRITLYVRCRGFRFFFQYLGFALVQLLKGRTVYIINLPNPFVRYLRPYVRWAYPEKNLSHTYFRADSSESAIPDSVVEKCYKLSKIVSVKAPYIQDIVLPKKRDSLSNENKQLVDEYMRTTGMNNYKTLRSLQRKANIIFALPIRKNFESWGVLVFDNNDKENPLDLEAKLKKHVDNYQKIIQLTINSLNL